jgi:hypothetical protein
VARIGFDATVIFSCKIYVPYLVKGQTTLYETPGLPESTLRPPLQPTSGDEEDDSTDGIEFVQKLFTSPSALKGYTVIEVLTPDMEFEREQ